MHKYIIIGVQGCGKGTQSKMLCEAFDLVHINVGDIFRWNIENRTKLGARIQRIVARGDFVSDEIVEQVVSTRLQEHDWNYGFLLDGFPRNDRQARFFLESYDIDAVIHIEVSDETVIQRMLGRRLCEQCGLDYNIIDHWPEVHNRCDVCGGPLVKRVDDTPEAIRTRVQTYHTKTEPVMDLFRRKELVVVVDGAASPVHVQREIRARLGLSEQGLPQEELNDQPA